MDLARAFDESELLADALRAVVDGPLFNEALRFQFAEVACSLALEHWIATRRLLQLAMLPSAVVTHRSQFESVLRSVWLTYAACDTDISKLSADLTTEAEQAAKNAPQTQDMMIAVEKHAPAQAFAALARFKSHSWKALNSYAHAGIHPLRRHADGYPAGLIHSVLCNSNGLAVLSFMQAVVLRGGQPLQRKLIDIASRFPNCMPPLL